MKLSKVLLSSAVAAALVFGFAGCANDEDEHGILNVSGDTASINYTNESDVTYRGFKTLKTKHTEATAIIKLNTKNADADTSSDDLAKAGVFGFVFDLDSTKTKDLDNKKVKNYSFSAVSVRYYNNNLEAYISRFENISPDYQDGGNNFKDIYGSEISTNLLYNKDGTKLLGDDGKQKTQESIATEAEWLKGDGAYAQIASLADLKSKGMYDSDTGVITVAVMVTAKDNGTYTIGFYNEEDLNLGSGKDSDGNKIQKGTVINGKSAIDFTGVLGTDVTEDSGVLTVPASWKEGATTTKQTEIGFYAAVYPQKTLVGSIQLPYILNEDEVIDWED